MSEVKSAEVKGTDWTRLMSDPDLVRNVGRLLQAYREAAPEKREETLLATMRAIKAEAASGATATPAKSGSAKSGAAAAPKLAPAPAPTPTASAPPFEPDVFSPNVGEDRRRHPRVKCFVAVELRVDGADAPIWGNLSNTSVGGCLVETARPVKSGAKVEIGLWVASGKIWVKGFALSGIVTRSGPANGIRVRFAGLEAPERDNLRQFLKYVQDAIRASRSEGNYLDLLK
jgi:PilZ domain